MKPVLLEVNTKLPTADSRINWEEGAYLVVDLHHQPPIRATKWRRLRADQTLVIDTVPSGEPVLVEIRRPWEDWEIKSLAAPDVQLSGRARFLTTGPVGPPIAVSTDQNHTVLHLSLRAEPSEVSVRIASRLALELHRADFEGAGLLKEFGRVDRVALLIEDMIPGVPAIKCYGVLARDLIFAKGGLLGGFHRCEKNPATKNSKNVSH